MLWARETDTYAQRVSHEGWKGGWRTFLRLKIIKSWWFQIRQQGTPFALTHKYARWQSDTYSHPHTQSQIHAPYHTHKHWKSWDASLVFFSLACSFLPCLIPPPLFPTLFLPLLRILSPYTFQIRGTWISPAMIVKPYFQVAQIWWAADSKVVVCLCIIVLVPASKDSR
jgi:hypothetical protein